MGEFGGNDYVFLLAAGKTVDEVMSCYVPKVIGAISAGVEVSTGFPSRLSQMQSCCCSHVDVLHL